MGGRTSTGVATFTTKIKYKLADLLSQESQNELDLSAGTNK